MKKKKSIILVVCALALFGCGEESSSLTSSPLSSSSVIQTSESSVSKGSSDVSVSTSSENVKRTIPTSLFKEQLNKTDSSMSNKTAAGFDMDEGKLSISFVDTKVQKEFDRDDNLLENQPDSQSSSFDLNCSSMAAQGSLKGLKETAIQNVSGSLSASSQVSLSYQGYEEESPSVKKENQQIQAGLYYADDTLFADLNDANLRNLASSILDVFSFEKIKMEDVPEFVKKEELLAGENLSLPLNQFGSEDHTDILATLVDNYDDYPTAFKNALTFKKDNDYFYADITVTKVILGALPLAFQTYAKSSLDETAEDYQTQCDQIDDITDVMNRIVAKMTLRNFNVQLAINDSGFAFAAVDIDFSISGYELSNETVTHTDGSYTQEINTLDSLSVTVAGQMDFCYDNDVTVESHGEHDYENADWDLSEISDKIKDLFGLED